MQEIGRAVLITGAASGIGAALARRIAGPETALLLHTRANRAGLDLRLAQLRPQRSKSRHGKVLLLPNAPCP